MKADREHSSSEPEEPMSDISLGNTAQSQKLRCICTNLGLCNGFGGIVLLRRTSCNTPYDRIFHSQSEIIFVVTRDTLTYWCSVTRLSWLPNARFGYLKENTRPPRDYNSTTEGVQKSDSSVHRYLFLTQRKSSSHIRHIGDMTHRMKQRGLYSEGLGPSNQKVRQFVSSGPRPAEVIGKTSVRRQQQIQAQKYRLDAHGGRKWGAHPRKPKTKTGFIQPKVMVPYKTLPGKPPRSIEVERKKRLYAAQDVMGLLKQGGVDYTKFALDVDHKTGERAYLPLQLFENTTYHVYPPEEWIRLGTDEMGKVAIPAKGLWFDPEKDYEGIYRPCTVTGWDETKRKFRIKWKGENAAKQDAECKDDDIEAILYRINLCFQAEDPFQYVKGVVEAHEARRQFECAIKYSLYVDSMPADNINSLDPEQQKRILSNSLNTRKLKQSGLETKPLLKEVNIDYARTMNKIIFDANLNSPEQQKLAQTLKGFPMVILKRKAPRQGCVMMPTFPYLTQNAEFKFNTFYTEGEAIQAMTTIMGHCLSIQTLSLFNCSLRRSCKLEEFQQLQNSTLLQRTTELRDSWTSRLVRDIRNILKKAGKGSLNIDIKTRDMYKFSKVRRFLRTVTFIMEDSVRFLAEHSLRAFHDYVLDCCSWDVKVHTINDVTVKRAAGKVESESFALFAVGLEIKNGKLAYATPIDQFQHVTQELYDLAVVKLQEIPQLEASVMQNVFKSTVRGIAKLKTIFRNPKPDPLNLEHKEMMWVQTLCDGIGIQLARATKPLKHYLETFKSYEEFISLDVLTYVDKFYEVTRNRNDIELEMKKHIEAIDKVEDSKNGGIPDEMWLGLYIVSCVSARNDIARKHKHIMTMIQERFCRLTKAKCDMLTKDFMKISSDLRAEVDSVKQMTDLKKLMKMVPTIVHNKQSDLSDAMKSFDLLFEYGYRMPKELFTTKWRTYAWPQVLHRQMNQLARKLESDQDNFVKELRQRQEVFESEFKHVEGQVATFAGLTELHQYRSISAKAKDISEKLSEFVSRSRDFNSKEKMMELAITEYFKVKALQKKFQPYDDLWTTTNAWRQSEKVWYHGPFLNLDSTAVLGKHSLYEKTIKKCLKQKLIRDNDELADIAGVILAEIRKSKPHLPLVANLRHTGMRPRHWTALSLQLEEKLKPDQSTRLLDLIEIFSLDDHVAEIVELGEVCKKEYAIETALKTMKSKWEGVEFTFGSHEATGSFILKEVEDITNQLDEHIIQTQTMQFSSFKKVFEEEIQQWNDKLRMCTDVIEQWLILQRNWMSLQPIFASPDIRKQLPREDKKFSSVSKLWKLTMSQVRAAPAVLEFCDNSMLKDKMTEANATLDQVQKALTEYLNTKRMAFARFYFLSDDQLLDILSKVRNPAKVQPFISKVFENIASLEFGKNYQITGMRSSVGELVKFVDPIDPRDREVEDWLAEVRDSMKTAMRYRFKKAVMDYKDQERNDWISRGGHPGQCVLQGSQVLWTAEVEAAFDAEGAKGIAKYLKYLGEQLMNTVSLAREKLPNLTRKILGPLIVLDVHAKTVVETLVEEKCEKKTDFLWIRQMRYYMEHKNLTSDNQEEKHGQIMVEMTKARFPMCYEYIGNSGRLVITPLTDRCYMTLMTALQLHLGGAPAGPAGTGKTETVKDLAKACAKFCVVFNCSEGMDCKMTGKFFRGLAMAGAWACFDEFNRINIEVLSVVAQQVTSIWNAIRTSLETFSFEDTVIPLDPTCCAFITMNPGYAGRTELPDNLAALFRPVAMMVPDYAMIAEIMLYSFGFNHAKALARKMVSTFTLCSEQLSAQNHYDYGMRAVFTVIIRAGLLKSMKPQEDEAVLVLSALCDVNVPKFLPQDLPLFEGIVGDLFPGKNKPEQDYELLNNTMQETSREIGLEPVPSFLSKCVQLYETTIVRHGMMLVGPAGGGKTSVSRCLSKSLTKLHGNNGYRQVDVNTLNPKAITMGQLYGENDPQTGEWQDGILAKVIRQCVEDGAAEDPAQKWVMFDGPVDALWIENMNTVLDDNKKLCLVSGEILALTPHMRMIFEVENLAVASPATVSRCGMVYMEPSALGLAPLIMSYINGLKTKCPLLAPFCVPLQKLFDQFLEPAVSFVRSELKEPVPSVDSQLAKSTMAIIDALLLPYMPAAEGKILVKADDVPHLTRHVSSIFLQALIWGVGGTTDQAGREKFHDFLTKFISESKEVVMNAPPEDRPLYDYSFDLIEGKWEGWMDKEEKFVVDVEMEVSLIVVPTVDSVRYSKLLAMLVDAETHVLFTGGTGTGKTVNVNQYFAGPLCLEDYSPITMIFSAATSANQVDDFLMQKLEKRRTCVYGPPLGQRFLVFVDDLNMPAREKYFAQPPIEFLRQWMDHGGWYNRQDMRSLPFIQVNDIGFIGAMGPPGGGRQPVTQRLLRHFTQIAHTQLVDSSKRQIFGTICSARLDEKSYGNEIASAVDLLVDSTVILYNTIAHDLLPTPEKSHYTFNLRDLSKVFQGILQASPSSLTTAEQLLRLWVHECRRVFSDRLINDSDRKWLDGEMANIMLTKFGKEWETTITGERLIWGDFLAGPEAAVESRVYTEATDLKATTKVLKSFLEHYNEDSKAPMKLVLFFDAIEHVSRIARIIRQPGGNALLLGVGGSGRGSLIRLSAHMAEYELFQIEISKGYNKDKWRDDLKEMFISRALKNIPTVFLYSDTQILWEGMLEDVNNILNSGEVPNLIQKDDIEEIYKECKNDCLDQDLEPTYLNVYNQFVTRVKQNIHVCMCMSPGSRQFRTRLRMFPSLVNCCTIDWFSPWPAEALLSVGTQKVEESGLEFKEIKTSQLVPVFQYIHQSVEQKSIEYKTKLRRYNYVTPTSYLELLSVYKDLLNSKRKEVGSKRDKLQNGLDKLEYAERQVAQLEIDLKAKQPVLAKTLEEVKATSEIVAKEKEAANVTKTKVEKQANRAKIKADECKAIEDDAQKDLDSALPLLDQAVKILKELNEGDITILKSFVQPPAAVVMTMEAMCIMLKKAPILVLDKNGNKRVKDYWSVAKRESLANPRKFIQDLINYDRDNIPPKIIKAIKPYIEDKERFSPQVIKKASSACEAVCKWVHAMYKYHFVLKMVKPKREKLQKATSEFKIVDAHLQKAQANLDAVMGKLKQLEDHLQDLHDNKKRLEDDVDLCKVKLDRADKLIGGLSGEKKRWASTIRRLENDYRFLPGDVLISAGAVSYLGAFVGEYRKDIIAKWKEHINAYNIPLSPDASVVSTLGDAVQIRKWNVCGLPTDELSVENGIIMNRARRWPLLIDPQEQASSFIKKLGGSMFEDGIKIAKLTDKNFARVMENAIRMGRWVLIESVQEALDPMLDPILGKHVFVEAGVKSIRLGDTTIPWVDTFRLYMSSKLPNPHYAPELQVKITLLNFTITPSGLEDQMLNMVVAKEQPDLQVKKVGLIKQMAKAKNQLQDIEDAILDLLKSSEGDILADEQLIQTLDNSKKTSKEISEQLREAEVVEKEIDVGRSKYKPVAVRASVLYFCIADLAKIDPMYQYSLEWFSKLFERAIANSKPSSEIEGRLLNLNNHFTLSLYENVCRSLFEIHKLLFSLLLTVRILIGQDKIDPQNWRFLVAGGPPKKTMQNPCGSWLKPNVWRGIVALSDLPTFEGFELSFMDAKSKGTMRTIAEHEQPHKVKLPKRWNERLTAFQKIMIIKIMRPDKMTGAIQNFIMGENVTGKAFVEPPPFDLIKSYNASRAQTPLVFVLSSGADPAKLLYDFAESKGMRETLRAISLGQGQGPKAERFIVDAAKKGTWVLLQNCHLAISWLPTLEKICEDLKDQDVDPNFRLWLTSLPSPKFPVSILQNGIKMTNEPPKGLRANLRGSFLTFSDEELTNCSKPKEFQMLLYGLCFFHANVLARREYGPLGWNIPYAFTQGDLDVSVAHLREFLDMYEDIPYNVLNYLIYDINYGGRVTDDKDRRTLQHILQGFMAPTTLRQGHAFSSSGRYVSPEPGNLQHYLKHISNLPLVPMPEAFGMHANAEITSANAATATLFRTILELLPREAVGSGKSREEQIYDQAENILKQVPAAFNMKEITRKYPLRLEESMNTVLAQETMRYNKLINVMRSTLQELMKALKGYVVMSGQLEAMANSLYDNLVPELWETVGFKSLMPLASWTQDLINRCSFFSKWIAEGIPSVFWISGFFFPQAFLTGAKQNFARKFKKAIDGVSFNFKILHQKPSDIKEGPSDGCYIEGLFIEGAQWDEKACSISNSRPKELFTKMAPIWLLPEFERKVPSTGVYRCPVYKVLTRSGTLSTTGHSTNFILWVEIPSKDPETKWIKAGVALFTALKYVVD